MKATRVFLFAILALVAGRAFAASFEGKIDLKMTEGRKTSNVSYYFKGDKMRIETSDAGESGAMIMDLTTKEMTMVMPSERMYMVMNAGAHQGPPPQESEAPVKTGRTEKILGYDCVEYTVTDKKTVTEYWAAKGLGVFRAMMRGGPGRPPSGPSAWELEAMRDGLFPLRIVEKSLKGKELSRMEATAIEPTSLSADLFAPPKGYQKFEMPVMPKMFGN